MLKKILLALIFAITAITNVTHAEDDMKTAASKAYVDTKIETKQLKIPAAGQPNVGAGETVMTYTATGNGQIGERGLYSDISSYDATTDGDKLITASALNATFTNLPTTPTTKLECANESDGCTLWTIVDQTAYGSGLPEGYTRLEYIAFSGGSYFDSGIVPNTYDYEIETKVAFDVLTGGPNCAWGYMGSSGNLPRWMLGTYGSGYLINANTTAAVSGADTNEHIFNAVIYDNNGVPYWQSYIDGEQKQIFALTSAQTWETNTLPIYIGARNNNGTAGNFGEVKIYYHKVTKGDTVIQHLIPCKKADGTLAFYDLVSGVFFTNQGSGTFVAGPED